MKKNKKRYCLSSTFFDTFPEALQKAKEYDISGNLDKKCRIVSVMATYTIENEYKGVLESGEDER